jgi:uncharacterized protein YidB (DUF937 family)
MRPITPRPTLYLHGQPNFLVSPPLSPTTEETMGILDGLLGGGRSRGGMSPITMALLGLLAYRTMQGKGRLADMLGTSKTAQGSPGGLGNLLGGLLGGGAAGGILSGGLADLIKQFQNNGQGDKAETWVAKGPNKPISPVELEQALGPDRVAWLMRETGLSREELLAGLSRELPNAIDQLTPEGHVPTPQDADRILQQQPARA